MKVVLTIGEILIWQEIKKAFTSEYFFYIFTRGQILAIEADVLYRPHLDENIFAPVLQLFLRGAAFLSIINILACVHRLSWQIHNYKYTSTPPVLANTLLQIHKYSRLVVHDNWPSWPEGFKKKYIFLTVGTRISPEYLQSIICSSETNPCRNTFKT